MNESWGVPNLSHPRQQAHLKALYYLTKSLDDTRLVIDNDGWEHTEVTDLFAIHDYTRTGGEFYRDSGTSRRGCRCLFTESFTLHRATATTVRRFCCGSSAE